MRDAGFANPVEDSVVIPIDDKLSLVQNIDIFTPLVDDGYIQGKIAACNVTNDIFAMNIRKVHAYQAFLGVPIDMPMVIARDILKGMDDFLRGIGSRVLGGHTIHNDWPLSGGDASGIEETCKILFKRDLRPGNVLYLTKPLGTQPLLAAYRVLGDGDDILDDLDPPFIQEGIKQALTAMTTSNKAVVDAIHSCEKNPVQAMSDVTGFGLWGTLKEIADQSTGVTAVIDKIVTFPQALAVADRFGYNTAEGKSAETAGGMLLAINGDLVGVFDEALKRFRVPHWRIGHVEKASGLSEIRIAANVEYVTENYTGQL